MQMYDIDWKLVCPLNHMSQWKSSADSDPGTQRFVNEVNACLDLLKFCFNLASQPVLSVNALTHLAM